MIEFRNQIYYFLQQASLDEVKISFEVRYQQSVKKKIASVI